MKLIPTSVDKERLGGLMKQITVGNTIIYSQGGGLYDNLIEALEAGIEHYQRKIASYGRQCPGKRIAYENLGKYETALEWARSKEGRELTLQSGESVKMVELTIDEALYLEDAMRYIIGGFVTALPAPDMKVADTILTKLEGYNK